jgi:hypothetical protein
MGGNDLLAAYGNDAAARAAIAAVVATGEDILARLAAPDAGTRIVISTVYDPSDGTGQPGPDAFLPPWPGGPALVRDLNTGLGRLAWQPSVRRRDDLRPGGRRPRVLPAAGAANLRRFRMSGGTAPDRRG